MESAESRLFGTLNLALKVLEDAMYAERPWRVSSVCWRCLGCDTLRAAPCDDKSTEPFH